MTPLVHSNYNRPILLTIQTTSRWTLTSIRQLT